MSLTQVRTGLTELGCRYFAETSSSTWALRLVSPASAEAEQGGHLRLGQAAVLRGILSRANNDHRSRIRHGQRLLVRLKRFS